MINLKEKIINSAKAHKTGSKGEHGKAVQTGSYREYRHPELTRQVV